MNKVFLQGRLTKDIELRYTTTNNIPVVTFSLAVDREYEKDKTDFINCVAYGKTAEFISKYFSKGKLLLAIGTLQTRFYDDKDGKRVYVTEVVIDKTYFTGDKETKEEFMCGISARLRRFRIGQR